MRAAILAGGSQILVLIIVGISIFLGFKTGSWLVFFIAIVIGVILGDRAYKTAQNSGRINMEPWLLSVADCAYKQAYDGTGIAIDTTQKRVFLTKKTKEQVVSRDYNLSDVREFGYEMPGATKITGGKVIGGGMVGAAHNFGNEIDNNVANVASEISAIENTGLWLRVKDIDCPQWFIKFQCKSSQDKSVKNELLRWMEILEQNINED